MEKRKEASPDFKARERWKVGGNKIDLNSQHNSHKSKWSSLREECNLNNYE